MSAQPAAFSVRVPAGTVNQKRAPLAGQHAKSKILQSPWESPLPTYGQGFYTVLLRSDGRAVFRGSHRFSACDVPEDAKDGVGYAQVASGRQNCSTARDPLGDPSPHCVDVCFSMFRQRSEIMEISKAGFVGTSDIAQPWISISAGRLPSFCVCSNDDKNSMRTASPLDDS